LMRYKEDLGIHHLDENKKNNNLNNLIIVCKSCHSRIHIKKLNGGKKYGI